MRESEINWPGDRRRSSPRWRTALTFFHRHGPPSRVGSWPALFLVQRADVDGTDEDAAARQGDVAGPRVVGLVTLLDIPRVEDHALRPVVGTAHPAADHPDAQLAPVAAEVAGRHRR